MKIELTQENVTILKELGVRSEIIGSTIIILECMFNGEFSILDILDDRNTNEQMLIIYKDLEAIGLLDRVNKKGDTNFRLTDMAIDILTAIGNKTPKELSLEEWIQDYQSLWVNPETGMYYQAPGKRSLGASAKDLTTRMSKFLSEYRDIFRNIPKGLTPKDIILEATERYVSEYKKVAFAYCKDSYNFIMKREEVGSRENRSLLASWCESTIMAKNHKPVDERRERNKSVN